MFSGVKRVNYDSQTLVTSTAVADALSEYAETVIRMAASVNVQIPALEESGEVVEHTLLLGPATSLETIDIDGQSIDEAERFPMPKFPGIGGEAVASSAAEFSEISTLAQSDDA